MSISKLDIIGFGIVGLFTVFVMTYGIRWFCEFTIWMGRIVGTIPM